MEKQPGSRNTVALLVFVAFANLFLFHNLGSLGLALIFLGIFVFKLIIFFKPSLYSKLITPLISISAIVAVLLFTLIFRSQEFVLFISVINLLLILALTTYLLATEVPFVASLLEFFEVPIRLFGGYLRGAANRRLALPFIADNKNSWLSKIKPILIGLLVAVPILLVLISLFSSADPIYASYIKKLLSFNFSAEFIQRIIFSVILGLLTVPILALTISRRQPLLTNFFYNKAKSFLQEMTVVMSLVALVIGSFLIVQWQYIFVSVPKETQLVDYGVKTYSEYVQKGFAELLFISAIIYGLLWLGLIVMRSKKEVEKNILKWVQIVVLIEFAIFIASIFRRIWLYQAHHGWSLVRLYGGFFLIWIAFIATTLLLRHFYKTYWVKIEAIGTAVLLVIFCFFNAESFIIHNHPPTVNNRIDYVYLSRMSADGTDGWFKAYDFAKETLEKYQNNAFLDKDARRDIFYAGIIVQELLYKSYDLDKKYASENELHDIKRQLVADRKEAYWDILLKLEASASVAFARATPQDQKTPIETEYENAKFRAIEFDKALEKLTAPLDTKQNYPDVDIDRDYYPDFDTYGCKLIDYARAFEPGGSSCKHSFISIYGWNKKYEPRSFQDRLFEYNAAESRAHRLLSAKITISELLQLSNQYFDLHNKILTQQDGERGVEVDISFETPFLY